MRKKKLLITIITLVTVITIKADIWDEIRTTALAPNNGPNGRALPLGGSWEIGWYKYRWGYNPSMGTLLEPNYIINLINNQHHLLVGIAHLSPDSSTTYYSYYMENALDYLEQKNQPVIAIGTQYEQNLYLKVPYNALPPSTSPRVYNTSQELLNKVTPFPPVISKWFDVGVDWTTYNPATNMLENIYPNPPKVIFLSNNESVKLKWPDAETSQRYIDLYGTGQTDEFKRQKISEGWIDCFSEMFDGMRSGLSTRSWCDNSIFVGYGCSGPWSCFARWAYWDTYSLNYGNQIAWEQNAWDGGSMSFYLNNGLRDYQVMSPQVGAQNRVFMLQDQLAVNPEFWHELSTWKGGDAYLKIMDDEGQTYTEARYKGLVQFGMWMLTPRVVRHYKSLSISLEDEGFEYFDAIMDSVDRVHTDPVLKKFWKYGELVENTSRQHPYQSAVPSAFASRPRWFMLNTDLDPATPWTVTTELPVFACARVLGTSPNREWLLYAHSPVQDRTDVNITLPGYGTVNTDVSREGTFVHVKENDNDLIAYYSLNDTANDISGNSNDGVLVNSPSYAAAKINNGISLSKASKQYINGGNSSILSSSMDELTISTWVKADTLNTNSTEWIIGKGSLLAEPVVCGFHLRTYHGIPMFYVGSTSVYGSQLQEGNWYHIAAVFKGGEYMKLYVNGQEYSKTTGVPASIVASNNYDLHIGNMSYRDYYAWDGIIDEVKIFNRVLSEEEIIDEAHKLIEFDFESLNAGTVADISRNGHTGNVINSPSLTRTRVAGNNGIQLNRNNSQYINCGHDASLNGGSELTVDIWVKADSLQENSLDWVLGKGNQSVYPLSGYCIRAWHKSLAFMVAGPNNTLITVTGPTLEEDVWYHIVAVYKGGQYLKLIVNDIEYSKTTNIPASIADSPNYDLHIGSGSYCGYYWDGAD